MANSNEFTGIIADITPTIQVSEKFRKRTLVLESDGDTQYPQLVPFTVTQDRCELLDDLIIGQVATVGYDLRGRRWVDPKNGEAKYFGELQAWRVSKQPSGTPAPPSTPRDMGTVSATCDPADDLAF